MPYAERTTVPVEKSIAEIVYMVKRAGAIRVAQYDEPDRFQIQFELSDRLIRFSVPLPPIGAMPTRNGRNVTLTACQREELRRQAHRQKARALMLVVKAKLESVDSGVETLEQAFLANVVMYDGRTVHDHVAQPIADTYLLGVRDHPLLTGPDR